MPRSAVLTFVNHLPLRRKVLLAGLPARAMLAIPGAMAFRQIGSTVSTVRTGTDNGGSTF